MVIQAAVLARPKKLFGQKYRRKHPTSSSWLNTVEGFFAKLTRRRLKRGVCESTAYAILDNYATHKHEKVRAWLTRHPNWTFHFTLAHSWETLWGLFRFGQSTSESGGV